MDDLITGSNVISELVELKEQLICLLSSGGFELHKWNTNVPQLLGKDFQMETESIELKIEQGSKLLGIWWKPANDSLHYLAPVEEFNKRVTKRVMLSEMSKLFDPLGLVGPVVTLAKILIQSLWDCKIGWDEPIPMSIQRSWLQLKSQLNWLKSIEIPRLIYSGEVTSTI